MEEIDRIRETEIEKEKERKGKRDMKESSKVYLKARGRIT